MDLTIQTSDTHFFDWDEWVDTSPQGSLFYHSHFLKDLPYTFRYYTVHEGNKHWARFAIPHIEGTPIAGTIPYTMYQGILFSKELADEPPHSRFSIQLKIIQAIFKKLIQENFFFSLYLHHSIQDLRGFDWVNFDESQYGKLKIDLKYTGILDISNESSFENYLKKIRKCRFQEYQKAKKDLKTKKGSLQDLDIFFELYRRTFERQNISIDDNNEELIRTMITSLMNQSKGELFFCTKDSEIIGATFFAFDQKTAYYLFSATNPNFRKLFSNTFLILENIESFFAKKIKYVDFVGINSPLRGDFKMSFNAEPKLCPILYWKSHEPNE